MRFITNLDEVLEKHNKWLNGDRDGERACLCEAILRGAYLCGAILSRADLRGADLGGAYLCGANLYRANLSGAYLRNANLRGAFLYEANLHEACLGETDLYGAKVDEATLVQAFPLCCPEEGSFVGWKKCDGGEIVKLFIPDNAKRSSAFGRKCRCSKAVVLEIRDNDGKPLKMAKSGYDNKFIYAVGETVQPSKPFDENRWIECASGIHFFMTKREAIDY